MVALCPGGLVNVIVVPDSLRGGGASAAAAARAAALIGRMREIGVRRDAATYAAAFAACAGGAVAGAAAARECAPVTIFYHPHLLFYLII